MIIKISSIFCEDTRSSKDEPLAREGEDIQRLPVTHRTVHPLPFHPRLTSYPAFCFVFVAANLWNASLPPSNGMLATAPVCITYEQSE